MNYEYACYHHKFSVFIDGMLHAASNNNHYEMQKRLQIISCNFAITFPLRIYESKQGMVKVRIIFDVVMSMGEDTKKKQQQRSHVARRPDKRNT